MPVPPALIWMLGAVGAAALLKKFVLDAKKAEMEAAAREKELEAAKPNSVPKLERDPETGDYRPPRA
ncbi:MAG TPA: hypothetical protein VIG34_00145 [Xanthobacteraceae bacterium]|jgi:hypothetical protein